MSYFKIYETLMIVIYIVFIITMALKDSDSKRQNLWCNISIISIITLSVMIFGGALASIWF